MRLAVHIAVAGTLLASGLYGAGGAQAAPCRFVKFATLPVDAPRSSPYIDGTVNGHAMRVLIDTGAVATSLTRSMAERASLTLAHTDAVSYGVSGESERYSARVNEVTFGPVRWTRANLAVIWRVAASSDIDALLGADFLFQNDIEMVLSEKQIRFFRPEDCAEAFLAYWDADAVVVSTIAGAPGDLRPMIRVDINGKPFRALIDSGATRSAIDQAAAAKAGVTQPTGERDAKHASVGIGSRAVETWVGTFDRVDIGSESIRNAKLDVMDMWGAVRADTNTRAMSELLADQPEVVLGADFLMAHRVLFAVSQRRVYFSHLGGPVFSVSP